MPCRISMPSRAQFLPLRSVRASDPRWPAAPPSGEAGAFLLGRSREQHANGAPAATVPS